MGNIIKRILKEDEGKHPLLGIHAIFDSSSNKEDIYKVLEILKNAGIPDNPDYDWIDDDVDTVYDDYIRHGMGLYLVANQHDRFGYVVGWGGAKFLNQNNILKLLAKEWIEIFSTDTSTFFDHLNEQEEGDNDIKVGDIFSSDNTLIKIVETECFENDDIGERVETDIFMEPSDKDIALKDSPFLTGKIKWYHDGCSLKYKISRNDGETWFFEDGGEGHWTEVGWIRSLIERGKWKKEVGGDVDFFGQLYEQEDDLQWARDVVNSENSLFGIKPFNSYHRNYSYIVFVGKDRTTEEIKLISEVLHKLGWRWAGGENATYSSHLKSISTYSRRSPETYIYMDYAGKMYYGSTISTFIEVNGRETYDNAIKIYL